MLTRDLTHFEACVVGAEVDALVDAQFLVTGAMMARGLDRGDLAAVSAASGVPVRRLRAAMGPEGRVTVATLSVVLAALGRRLVVACPPREGATPSPDGAGDPVADAAAGLASALAAAGLSLSEVARRSMRPEGAIEALGRRGAPMDLATLAAALHVLGRRLSLADAPTG